MKIVAVCLLMLTLVSSLPVWGEDTQLMRPYPGISADALMKINLDIKFTKFARDYKGIGRFELVNKKGFVRTRDWGRYRIILDRESEVFDYKDLVVILSPQNIKGLSVLNWTYLDPNKNQEVWLWLPSLRKVRRISQSEADDPFMGSEFTTEEMSTRKFEDETYSLIGEKTFDGYTARSDGTTYYKDTDCYVLEARPKRENWYYSKRVVWLHKDFAGLIFDEVYDQAGRRWKTFLKHYETWEDRFLPQLFLEGVDLLTDHTTVIGFEKDKIEFNSGLKEGFFTEKTLMRSKW